VAFQGRTLPYATNEWYAITFANENGSCGNHYRINLFNNGNPIFMNVFQNCSNAGVTCNAVGDAGSNYTQWDWTNSGAYCTQSYPTTFYVQVVPTSNSLSCLDYSLVAFQF